VPKPDLDRSIAVSHELFYTSVPRGLQPGSRGFCTVAHTQGIAAPLMQKLEGLSGYRPLFSPLDERAHLNPVAWSHLQITVTGKTYHVLSRVCAAGLDYSQRTNKFAHHVALEAAELPTGGPAWTLQQRDFLETAWSGEPRLLPQGRTAPRGDAQPGACRTWQQVAGDAGWAGYLAEATLVDPNKTVCLVTDLGVDVLALFAEALALLPPERRWTLTFSTYFATLPAGQPCSWRWLQKDSAEARAAVRQPNLLILDLSKPLGPAQGGALVECARSGQAPPRHVPQAARLSPAGRGREPAPALAAPPQARGDAGPTRPEPLPPAPLARPQGPGVPASMRKAKPVDPHVAQPSFWLTFLVTLVVLITLGGGLYVAWRVIGADTELPTPEEIAARKPTRAVEPRPTSSEQMPDPPFKPAIPPEPPPMKAPDEPAKTPMTSNGANTESTKQPAPVKEPNDHPKPVVGAPTPPPLPAMPDEPAKPLKAAFFPLPERVQGDGRVQRPLKEWGLGGAAECRLELLGLEDGTGIPGSGRKLRVDAEKRAELKVLLDNGMARSDFAVFTIENEALSFRWGDSARYTNIESKQAADLLYESVLRIKVGETGRTVHLAFRHLGEAVFVFDRTSLTNTKPEVTLKFFPLTLRTKSPVPKRELWIDYATDRHPVLKHRKGEVVPVRACDREADWMKLKFGPKGESTRAMTGVAATYYFDELLLPRKLLVEDKKEPALLMEGTFRITWDKKMTLRTREELEQERRKLTAAFDEEASFQRQLKERLNREKDGEKYKQLVAEGQRSVMRQQHFRTELRTVEAEFSKWLDDDQELKKDVKLQISVPAGLIYMEVEGVRVDVYRIVER
jgi:hypothetical protein